MSPRISSTDPKGVVGSAKPNRHKGERQTINGILGWGGRATCRQYQPCTLEHTTRAPEKNLGKIPREPSAHRGIQLRRLAHRLNRGIRPPSEDMETPINRHRRRPVRFLVPPAPTRCYGDSLAKAVQSGAVGR